MPLWARERVTLAHLKKVSLGVYDIETKSVNNSSLHSRKDREDTKYHRWLDVILMVVVKAPTIPY